MGIAPAWPKENLDIKHKESLQPTSLSMGWVQAFWEGNL